MNKGVVIAPVCILACINLVVNVIASIRSNPHCFEKLQSRPLMFDRCLLWMFNFSSLRIPSLIDIRKHKLYVAHSESMVASQIDFPKSLEVAAVLFKGYAADKGTVLKSVLKTSVVSRTRPAALVLLKG